MEQANPTDGAAIGAQARASCVISDGVSDRAAQWWVLKQPTRYHLLNLFEKQLIVKEDKCPLESAGGPLTRSNEK